MTETGADGWEVTTKEEEEAAAAVVMTMTLLLHTTISLNLERKSPIQKVQDSGRGWQLEERLAELRDMRWAGDIIHEMTETRGQDHHIPGAVIMVIEMTQVRLQGHHSLFPLLGQILVSDLRDEGERGRLLGLLLERTTFGLLAMSDVLLLM